MTHMAVYFMISTLYISSLTEGSIRCRIKTDLDFTRCSLGNHPLFPPVTTPSSMSSEVRENCKKTFRVSEVFIEPYSFLISQNLMYRILRICCSSLSDVVLGPDFKDMNHLNLTSIQPFDVIAPVLVPFGRERLYGYYFIPLLEIREGFFITLEKSSREILRQFLLLLSNQWPLLITMLLFATIAGFIIWIMETWSNEAEFSRSFRYGLLDGFWWSFITMTTVGYGDKAPKFLGSRFFSILWILIGITVCSVFTASLTTGLMNLKTPSEIKVERSKVGVLKGRLSDAVFVTRSGGKIEESSGTTLNTALPELIDRTKSESIDGFFLDTFTYMHVKRHFRDANLSKDVFNFIQNESKATEIEFPGEKKERSVYGILLKNKKDYEFFRYAFEDNKEEFDLCNRWEMGAAKPTKKEKRDIFSPSGGYFLPLFYGNLTFVLIIICFGVVYEIVRTRYNRKTNRKTTPENGISSLNNQTCSESTIE